MFSLISSSLSGCTGRFMSYALGKNDTKILSTTFCMSMNINIILALVCLLGIETLGLWFLNNKLVIPVDRLNTAFWVFQLSTVGFGLNLLSVPYNATIIAYEKMSAFAYMTIFDAAARLVIVLGIYYYKGDRLLLMSSLGLFVGVFRQFIIYVYCRRTFSACRYNLLWDKRYWKEMFAYAGWAYVGCSAGLLKDQGVNILINMFYDPTVNTARAISMQVRGIVGQFVGNFTIAMNPQIIKEYASGNVMRMHSLIFRGARFSFYLMFILSLPIIFEIKGMLCIWLGQVPEHTVLFVRLVLVLSLLETVSNSLIVAQSATGNIRDYQIVVGGIMLLNVPISYILLRSGFFPEVTVCVAIVLSQFCLIGRLFFLRRMIRLSARAFLNQVYLNILFVSFCSMLLPMVLYIALPEGALRFCLVCIGAIVSASIMVYYIGCSSQERQMVLSYFVVAKNKLKSKHK